MRTFQKATAAMLSAALTVGIIGSTPVSTQAAMLGSASSGTFQGHTYALFTTEMNWKEAKAYCEELGGHLVTITSAEENQYLVDKFLSKRDSGVSIGFTDEASEGNWKWVTGESASDYSNWDAGEPNNEAGEDYALMQPSGLWNDGHLEVEDWAFICEWDTAIQSVKKCTLYKKQVMTVKVPFSKTVSCKSTKSSVVKAKKNKITALKKGKAVITATNSGKSNLLVVTVKNPTLNKKSVKLKVGSKYKLKITGKVGKATFKSTKNSVASVNSSGKITAKKKGKATIKVKTNGMTLTCKVTVK